MILQDVIKAFEKYFFHIIFQLLVFYKSQILYNSKVTNIIILNSVNSIGYNAFRECLSLTNITILNNVAIIERNVLFNEALLKGIIHPESIKLLNNNTIEHNINTIIIQNNFADIGDGAFSKSSLATSITIL